MLTTEAPFYLSFNYSKDSSRCWFKANAMDVNKLKSLMKTKANKAGLDKKRRLTNRQEKSFSFTNEGKRIDNPRIKIVKCAGAKAHDGKCQESLRKQKWV